MIRSIVAFVVMIIFTISSMAHPAYASPSPSTQNVPAASGKYVECGVQIGFVNSCGSNNQRDSGYSSDASQEFVNNVVNGAVTTAGFVIGGAVTCYVLDGIATAFFPPAAALAAFCPVVGGGASAGVQALAGAK